MSAGLNYNIQSAMKKIATKSGHVTFGSSVAAGMTRYVTCIGVVQDLNGAAAGGSRVIFCSTAASGGASNVAAGSASAKISIGIGSFVSSHEFRKSVYVPPGGPSTEHPLFTIAASKFFTAVLGSVAGTSVVCEVFAQWYDQ